MSFLPSFVGEALRGIQVWLLIIPGGHVDVWYYSISLFSGVCVCHNLYLGWLLNRSIGRGG
jgi:hypothetical protein